MSDDDAPAALPSRGRAVAAADSDSEDEAPRVAQRGTGNAAAKAAASDSDSDSDEGAKVAPPRRGGDSEESDEETESDDDTTSTRKPVQLWLPIDYDNMTKEQFYNLLNADSRADRIEEKRQYEEQMSEKQKTDDPIEHFIDSQTNGYTYRTMLTRVFTELRQYNPDLGDVNRKAKLPVPKIEKIGSKKTGLLNFEAMCKAMTRDLEHVKDFIEKHLTTTCSVDGNKCLIMKLQNVKSSQIEQVFQKYIEEFCQCKNCASIDTDLTKDPNTRLWNLRCRTCKAGRSVQAASSATYQATTTKRSRMRAKAAL